MLHGNEGKKLGSLNIDFLENPDGTVSIDLRGEAQQTSHWKVNARAETVTIEML